MGTTEDCALLRRLEEWRCKALLDGDRSMLRQLLHKDLIYVHEQLRVETYESYTREGAFECIYTSAQSQILQIHVCADKALLAGQQVLQGINKVTGELQRVNSSMTQVWARQGVFWQLLVFHACNTAAKEIPSERRSKRVTSL